MHRKATENPVIRFFCLMVRRYLRHGVGAQAAALAFYLLFMIFPFAIFLSALLGLLHLDIAGIIRALGEVMPREAVGLIGSYLAYVQDNSSVQLAVFGLVFSIWFPTRAANALMRSVRTAYHLGPPRTPVLHMLKSLLYTAMLIVTVALTLLAITVSDRILAWAVANLHLPEFAAALWGQLRFPVAGVAGFFALYSLYALAQDTRQSLRNIWPGTVFALGAWLALSWLYNFYVENFARYSLLYGSIGTIIVLLIWLNMTAMVLIMGAEMNGVLMTMRAEKEENSGGTLREGTGK